MTYSEKDELSHLLKHSRGFITPAKTLEHWRDLLTRQAQLLEAVAATLNDARFAEVADRFRSAADDLHWQAPADDPSFYTELERKHRRARRPTKPRR